MKHGRPTKYKPEYCEFVIKGFSEGKSMSELCLDLGVSPVSFRSWKTEFPEFGAAVREGLFLSRGWWEKQGRVGLRESGFNHGLWFMNVKNRFGKNTKADFGETDPDEVVAWGDKQHHEVTGKDGKDFNPEKPLTVNDAAVLLAAFKGEGDDPK